MLYPEGKQGKTRIGEDMRNLIEDTLGLKRGALDDGSTAITEIGGEVAPSVTLEPAPKAASTPRPLSDVSASQTTLERLDAAEKQILEMYRRSTRDGKMMILGAATVAPKENESELAGRSD